MKISDRPEFGTISKFLKHVSRYHPGNEGDVEIRLVWVINGVSSHQESGLVDIRRDGERVIGTIYHLGEIDGKYVMGEPIVSDDPREAFLDAASEGHSFTRELIEKDVKHVERHDYKNIHQSAGWYSIEMGEDGEITATVLIRGNAPGYGIRQKYKWNPTSDTGGSA